MTDLGSGQTSGAMSDPTAAAEEAVQRIRELNERFIESAKAAGNQGLDAYEKALQNIVEFQEKAAGATQLDWVQNITQAQAKFFQDVSNAYVSAAREMLK
jgi:Phasin protein